MKIFADGVQIFRFLDGRWRITDAAEKYRLWKDNLSNAKLADMLQRLIEANYLPKVKNAPPYQFDVTGSSKEGDATVVKVKAAAKGTELPLDFKMIPRGAAWKIYDVVIDGVGLVETYSEQFERIAAKDGVPGLFSRLEQKLAATGTKE